MTGVGQGHGYDEHEFGCRSGTVPVKDSGRFPAVT